MQGQYYLNVMGGEISPGSGKGMIVFGTGDRLRGIGVIFQTIGYFGVDFTPCQRKVLQLGDYDREELIGTV